MLYPFIFFAIILALINILIWIFDASKSKASIQRSKKVLLIGFVIAIIIQSVAFTVGLFLYLRK